jgi:hypothetical protein
MFEKEIIDGILCLVFVGFLSFCFAVFTAGCRTVGKPVDQSVLDHQARIIELEDANRALTERLGQYDSLIERTVQRLENVRERAASIGDAADRIEYLFAEYERTVQQLIYELRSNGGKVGKGATDYKDVIYYIALLDRFEGFADYCWLYMAGYQ